MTFSLPRRSIRLLIAAYPLCHRHDVEVMRGSAIEKRVHKIINIDRGFVGVSCLFGTVIVDKATMRLFVRFPARRVKLHQDIR